MTHVFSSNLCYYDVLFASCGEVLDVPYDVAEIPGSAKPFAPVISATADRLSERNKQEYLSFLQKVLKK